MQRRRDQAERFRERYAQPASDAALAVEREAIGANVGANGYTTLAQATLLADRLGLSAGSRLLDIGSGRGWPGVYLAETTGCAAVLSDVPEPALRIAVRRIDKKGLGASAQVIKASAVNLPFAAGSFTAVCHSDTL